MPCFRSREKEAGVCAVFSQLTTFFSTSQEMTWPTSPRADRKQRLQRRLGFPSVVICIGVCISAPPPTSTASLPGRLFTTPPGFDSRNVLPSRTSRKAKPCYGRKGIALCFLTRI